ncbi:MAG: DUF11 domain-containing protein [Actinobacteria bacterium]|nr:DUF11 domain-containing protein [Actinomycetota bacterium]
MDKIKRVKEILKKRFAAIRDGIYNFGRSLKRRLKKPANPQNRTKKGGAKKTPAAKKAAAKKAAAKKAINKNKPLNKKVKTEEADTTKPASSKKKILWITIPVVLFILLAGAALGYYFYFYYYLKPNFSEEQYQDIVSDKTGMVEPGDKITYTVNLKNTGNTTVENMAITTSLPEYCSLISSSPEAVFDIDNKKITFNIASIPKDTAQKASFTVQVESPLDDGTIIQTSKVFLNYDVRDEAGLGFEIDKTLQHNVSSSPVLDDFGFLMTDLNLGEFNIKDVVQIDLSVKNTGNMHAKDIDVITALPDKFQLFETSVVFPAAFDREKNILTWKIRQLPVGSSKKVSFMARLGTGFEHLETFKVTSSLVYSGSTVTEQVFEGTVVGYPNFSDSSYTVADTSGGSVWAGDILRYYVTVKNTGMRPGKNFKLICPVPANTTFLSDSVSTAEGFEYDSGKNAAVWTIDNLEIDEERVFEFSVAISQSLTGGGAINSEFTIEGDEQFVELGKKTVGVRKYIYHTIVCMGDSLLAYTNWHTRLDAMLENTYPRAEYNTVAVAVPGQMSHQGYHKFDVTVAPNGPQIIVFGYGSNDVGTSVRSFINGMTGLINKGKGMGATVIVHSIGWINTDIWVSKRDYKAYNDALRDLCASAGVPYVDIYTPIAGNPGKYISDGLHLTSEGANLVASLVFNTMRNYLDADGARR